MKRIIILFATSLLFLFVSVKTAKAQDLLILKTGKEIKVNIIGESPEIVKYREFDDPSGPLYSISRDKISSIKYKKGSGDTNMNNITATEKIKSPGETGTVNQTGTQLLTVRKRHVLLDGKVQSSRNIKTIMEDYPDAVKLYDSGLKMCNISNGCAVAVIITSFISSQMSNTQDHSKNVRTATVGLCIDGAFIITGIVLATAGKHRIRNSVSLYNSSVSKPVSYKLDFGLQDHGVGLALRF